MPLKMQRESVESVFLASLPTYQTSASLVPLVPIRLNMLVCRRVIRVLQARTRTLLALGATRVALVRTHQQTDSPAALRVAGYV